MAWEWIGAAAGVAGVIVGCTGIILGLRNERKQRRQAPQQDAYMQLLALVADVWVWAQRVCPMMDTDPPQPDPPSPDPLEDARVRTLVDNFGSVEVKAKFEAWHAIVQRIIDTVSEIKSADAREVANRARRILDLELRADERSTRDALLYQVALELGDRKRKEKGTASRQ